ncbi:MAG: T9SS type A sorting domain-containing protein [Ignavibacteriales bacterium]|nr:T9SS type A sorting domain-containing protein [Ignavibacteriales bacterium]
MNVNIQKYRSFFFYLFATVTIAAAQVVEKATLASPTNGAVNQQLTATLQWQSASGASSYHIQVSTSPTFASTIVDQSGINSTTHEVGPLEREKIYYWRVRGEFLGIDGAWSDTWNFGTIPNPPAAPTLSSPGNLSTNQPLSLTISWNVTPKATGYRVQSARNSLFTNSLRDTTIGSSTTLSLQNLQRESEYFWRVQVFNAGGTSAWSTTYRFTTIPNPPQIPALHTPANNVVDQPVALALSWTPTSTTTSYHVQLSIRSDFSTVVYNDSLVADTTVQIESLQRDTLYFWRVQSINAGGTSGWSSSSQFRTIPNPPSVSTLRSPINSATDQPVTLHLSWSRVNTAASYRLQMSLRSNFSTLVLDSALMNDTIFQIQSLLVDTTYFWRVAAANSGGQGVWSAVWSFTTIPQQPAIPTVSSPVNGSFVDTNAVLFSWSAVSKTSSYWLQVSQDSLFGTFAFNDSAITGISHRVPELKYNDRYFWRIKGKNSGGSSPWTTAYSFITRSKDSYAGPELESPGNGSVDQPQTITLRWKPVLTALSYQVQVSTNSSFTSIVFDNSSLLTESIQVESLDGSTKYYWRVRSLYLIFASEWSDVWNFTTVPNSPSVPALVEPLNNATNVPTGMRFLWRPVTSATSYHLQVSTDQSFSTLIINDASVIDTVCRIESLAENTKYYWHVAALNNGGASSWSSTWSFETNIVLPPPPDPIYPPNGLTLESNTVTISWNSAPNAISYWLQLAFDSAFTAIVLNDSTIGTTSRKISGLVGSTRYFWRVRSNQSQNNSQWSQPNNFTTGQTSSSAGPSLNSPADNSTNQPTTITLRWDQDAGAASYHVQLSKNQNFSPTVLEDYSVTGTSIQTSSLEYGTAYYWRVRSNYLLVSSDWSSVWKFTTTSQIPNVPTLVSPANGATNQPLRVTVRWSSSPDTLRYHLQVATDSIFSSLTENDTTLSTTSKELRTLAVNRSYYWRVRAGKDGLWSAFSPYWTLTTKAGDLPSATTEPPSALSSTSATISALVSANGYETTVRFQYGTTNAYGNSVDGIPLTIPDTATGRKITNTLYGLTPNTTYHYRVSTTNQLGSTEGEDRSFTTLLPPYPGQISIDASFQFPTYKNPSDYKPTHYRIIGLPGNCNTRVDSMMLGIQRSDWEIYWDNGDGERILVPFDGSQNFSFTTGRAYWFIKKGPLKIERTISAAALDSMQEVKIQLHPGWNLITNPFNSIVAWSQLQSVNGITQPIYSFDGSFSISDTLRPYVGYYFFNDSAKNYLRVPYATLFSSPAPAPASAALPKSTDRGWKLSIGLTNNEYADRATWFGIEEEKFRRQIHKPAGFDMLPAVYFDRPDWNERHRTFATDMRSAFDHRQSWEFNVWLPARNKSQVTVSGIHSVPDQFEVYLIDLKASRCVNLRNDSTYVFSPADRMTTMKIVVGTSDSIRQILESVKTPASFTLGNNYPNPFNPETSIPVTIPFRSFVELSIFNILGQRIQTIQSGTLEPGNYWFRWNGKNHDGSTAPSGVYLSQLTTSNGISIAKKMLLTK